MTLEITTHRNILLHLLKEVYTHPSIGAFLGFNGGTAAYLFYELDRFSVDLDFDLLNQESGSTIFLLQLRLDAIEKKLL